MVVIDRDPTNTPTPTAPWIWLTPPTPLLSNGSKWKLSGLNLELTSMQHSVHIKASEFVRMLLKKDDL